MTDPQSMDPNAFFLAFHGHQIPAMAQAVLDSGYLAGECDLAHLKQVFKDRGLGEANVMNFFRYVKLTEDGYGDECDE